MTYITEAVSNVSLQPSKVLSAWVTDQVAPSYWRPNNEIQHCHKCKNVFGPTDTKHHCRACGEGFCSKCSSNTMCVPLRNWHTPVRVCDTCYNKDSNSNDETTEYSEDVNARKVSEQIVSTLSAVGTVLSYSKCKKISKNCNYIDVLKFFDHLMFCNLSSIHKGYSSTFLLDSRFGDR